MTSHQRPSATCRSLRGSAWQRAMANGHRGWKWQPLGGARARISPLIGAKIRRRCSICGISSSNLGCRDGSGPGTAPRSGRFSKETSDHGPRNPCRWNGIRMGPAPPAGACAARRGSARWRTGIGDGSGSRRWGEVRISPLIGAKIRRRCSICGISSSNLGCRDGSGPGTALGQGDSRKRLAITDRGIHPLERHPNDRSWLQAAIPLRCPARPLSGEVRPLEPRRPPSSSVKNWHLGPQRLP